MRDINLKADLFLCPVVFDSDIQGEDKKPAPVEDKELHYTNNAVNMLKSGSELFCADELPGDLVSAKETADGLVHFRIINSPDGKAYIPLFCSYSSMTHIFGKNIRIGVISFFDAAELCLNESNISGIVVAPGHVNKVLEKETVAGMIKPKG